MLWSSEVDFSGGTWFHKIQRKETSNDKNFVLPLPTDWDKDVTNFWTKRIMFTF